MSYSEENDQVVLRLSRDDYQKLMITLGIAAGSLGPQSSVFLEIFGLTNRLNEGNPTYRPYRISESANGSSSEPPRAARFPERP